jgi:hypothetical protein
MAARERSVPRGGAAARLPLAGRDGTPCSTRKCTGVGDRASYGRIDGVRPVAETTVNIPGDVAVTEAFTAAHAVQSPTTSTIDL